MERIHVIVTGRVQGVGFRQFVAGRARAHALTGWVRNLPDGRVEAVAEGPRQALETLIAYCWKGPLLSKVSGVEVTWEAPSGAFEGFDVTRWTPA